MPSLKDLTRRDVLAGIGAMTCTLALPFPASGRSRDSGVVRESTEKSLREHASRRGLLYGAAAGKAILTGNKALADLFVEQCGIVVPENDLKFKHVHPKPDEYDFSKADWLLDFAESHDMKMRGHTLVCHEFLPDWFDDVVNESKAQRRMEEHLTRVMHHFAGKLHSWDVVNEPLEAESWREDGLRDSPWLKLLGPDYIEKAFHIARDADKEALLCWNENRIQNEDPPSTRKRTLFLKWLRDLKRRNVPIDAIGIESHLTADGSPVAGENFKRFLREVADLGLKLLITEMDVADDSRPKDVAVRDRAVAQLYYHYLHTVLKQKNVIAVLNWGLSNGTTWLAQSKARADAAPVRPLPFDDQMNPTLAFKAIARAFDKAPGR